MANPGSALDGLEREARAVTREAAPWVEQLARFGYAAKGLVYILVGLFALRAARGNGQPTDSRGALRSIVSQPAGQVLIWVVALALLGYVLWRFVEAGLNPEGNKPVARVAHAISGFIYAGLALEAARLAMGRSGGQSGDQKASHWTAEAMSHPLGKWAVVIVGVGIAAFGLQQIYNAYRVKLDEQLSLASVSPSARRWVVRTARAGLAARGVVFTMVGGFLLLAGLRTDPGEARGVGGALQTLQQQPFGPWLLGAVGVGLAAYGIYELVRARYRRIRAA